MTASIGIDVSTQGVKALALDGDGAVVARAALSFDEPFRANADPTVREADPLMWLRGADRVMSDLAAQGVPVGSVPLVGCGADRPGCAVISLGTSDVFMATAPDGARPADGCGHVFGNPSGGLMALVCVKNGSLARDRVRRELGVDWTFFD